MSLPRGLAFVRAVTAPMLLGIALVSCSAADSGGDGGTGVPVPTTISVATPAITMNTVGRTASATVTVRDGSGDVMADIPVTWSSDSPAIATVSGTGSSATITAAGRGAAIITARAGGVSTSITVLVRTAFAVAVSPSAGLIRTGALLPLQALVGADDGASRAVVWSSDNPAIATISLAGVVRGVAPGTATITARSTSDDRLSATAVITVAPARSVFVSPSAMNIGRAEARTITAQVFVDDGLPTGVSWRSNRPLIATVNQQGVVTGVSDGEATITAVAVADTTLRAFAVVSVVPVVRSIVVAPESAVLEVGQSNPFTATVVADQGVSSAVEWLVDNPAVASVNAQGVATAVGIGSTTVRARSVSDSSRVATAQLTVVSRPVELTLGQQSLGLTVGSTATLSAAVVGDPGISTAVRWTSRNSAVASITTGGTATAIAGGTTWLVVQSVADPSKQDSVRTTVVPQLADGWSTTRLGGPLIEDIMSLWAPTSALAYAVNSLGDLYQWDGVAWQVVLRGTTYGTTFAAVHGISASAISVVGSNGVIVRFDGTSWTEQNSGTSSNLTDVWMHTADTVWAVGENGAALRRMGASWTAETAGTSERFEGVWGSATVAYAVGASGVVRRWQSGGWQPLASGTTQQLNDVWGVVNGSVYVVGAFGTVLRWNGSAFVAEVSATTANLFAISGNGSGSIMAAGDGVVLTRPGGTWNDQSPPYNTRFSAATVDANGALWVGGQRGLVMQASPLGGWSTLSLTPDLLDAWSTSDSHALTVGELGFVFRWDGVGWTREVTPTLERLNTVWAEDPSIAFAGGDNGVLLRWSGSNWESVPSPTTEHIYAMWGARAEAVWAVTEGGEILFWDGSEWGITHQASTALFGIYGTSDSDVHVVGQNGTVLHWNDSVWESRPVDGTPVLVGLWASDPASVFAVGARDFSSGVTLRYDGNWNEVAVGTSRILSAVWGAVDFDLYAVGDAGTIVRFNGIGWSAMPSGTSEFLWAVTGAPDGSGGGFAVGLNGVVVQAEPFVGAMAAGRRGSLRAPPGGGQRHPNALAPRAGARRAVRGALPEGKARRGLGRRGR